jgi:hypothetical protein
MTATPWRYANFDHAGWLAGALGRPVDELTPLARKVAIIIGIAGGGIYNAPCGPTRMKWDGPWIEANWYGDLSTFDYSALTVMVLLCHEARVRLSIKASGPRRIKLIFSERRDCAEDTSAHHPSIDDVIVDMLESIGRDHPIHGDTR